jgi:RNA polymerase sigma-70 factor (ECF subfamily)
MPSSIADRELVRRIRQGEERAWRECIGEFEGRLQAFVYSRLGDRDLAEDLVQDTFLGFLTALPNYDDATPLETFLFAIAAHKITDTLRRQGRRPLLKLDQIDRSGHAVELPGNARAASTMARSRERRQNEEQILSQCLRELVLRWLQCDVERLKCAELLFVQGMPNKQVAALLAITEQDVANHKHYILDKLRAAARRAAIDEAEFVRLGLGSD